VFSCLIDDYDTIIKAELFIYDMNTNVEVCKVSRYLSGNVEKKEITANGTTTENSALLTEDTLLPIYGGRGDDSMMSIQVPRKNNNIDILTNGKEYKWKIRLYSQNNDVWITDGKTPNDTAINLISVSKNSRIDIGQSIKINTVDYLIESLVGNYDAQGIVTSSVENVSVTVLTNTLPSTITNNFTDLYITINSIDYKIKEAGTNFATGVIAIDNGIFTTSAVNNKYFTIERRSYVLVVDKQTTTNKGTPYIISSNFLDSNEFYFTTVLTPTITQTWTNTLDSSVKTFTATYNGNMSYYIFEVYEYNSITNLYDVLLDKTNEIFSSNISYTYEEFLNEKNYKIILTVMSKEKIKTSEEKVFSVSYASSSSLITPQISIDCNRNAIKIDYSTAYIIRGIPKDKDIPSNSYELGKIDSTQIPKCFVKDDQFIEWTHIEGGGQNIDLDIPKDFTMVLRVKAEKYFNGDIFEMTDVNGNIYKLRIDNEKFYYKIGTNTESAGIDIYDAPTPTDILPLISASNNSSTPIYRKRYEWKDDISWSNTGYFLFNNDFTNYWWNIYVYKNGIVFYLDNGNMVKIELFQSGTFNIGYKAIKIYGNINYNFITVYKNTLSELQRNDINLKHSYIPDYDNGIYFSLNFKDNINSSNMDTVNGLLKKYNIYRKNMTTGNYKKIAELNANQKVLYDYAVNIQYLYKYYITPIYEEFGTLKTLFSAPIETQSVTPNWYNYSIIGTKSNFNINKNNIFEADPDNIWIFSLNIENGDINITTDKTIYDGFSTYAKVNQGIKNYKSGSVTMMLGKIIKTTISSLDQVTYDKFTYTDSVELANKWQQFCNNGLVKLFRDKQGNTIPVDITAKSFKYNDNYTPSNITISFDWVQIANENTVSVYEPIDL
jgi:hypothetical protein